MSKLMKKKGLRTFLVIVVVIAAFVLFFKHKGTNNTDNKEKYEGVDFEAVGNDYCRTDTYSIYASAHGESMPEGADNTYDLDVFGYTDSDGVTKRSSVGPDNDKSDALQIPEKGYVEFTVDVKQAGYYSMCAEYYPTTDEDDREFQLKQRWTSMEPCRLAGRTRLRSSVCTRMKKNRRRIIREMRSGRRRSRIRTEAGCRRILRIQPDMR